MQCLSSLIEFLLGLLRDEQAQAEFVRDPQAMLARHGLEGVTAQDIYDAQPVLADTAGVQAAQYQRPRADDDDPIREIHHVVNTHTVDTRVVVKHETPEFKTFNEYVTQVSYTDNSIHADTVIQDSFNQDNDGVDNKGGVIDDSNVAGGDQGEVGNTDEDTTVTDSFDEDSSETAVIVDSGNAETTTTTTATDSFNDVSSSTAVDVNNSYNADSSTQVGRDLDQDAVDVDAVGVAG